MVGHADHGCPQHGRMEIERVLDLDAVRIPAASNRHVLLAVEQPEVAFLIDLRPVARQDEAVTPEDLGGLAGLVPVAGVRLLASAVDHRHRREALVQRADAGLRRGMPAEPVPGSSMRPSPSPLFGSTQRIRFSISVAMPMPEPRHMLITP